MYYLNHSLFSYSYLHRRSCIEICLNVIAVLVIGGLMQHRANRLSEIRFMNLPSCYIFILSEEQK